MWCVQYTHLSRYYVSCVLVCACISYKWLLSWGYTCSEWTYGCTTAVADLWEKTWGHQRLCRLHGCVETNYIMLLPPNLSLSLWLSPSTVPVVIRVRLTSWWVTLQARAALWLWPLQTEVKMGIKCTHCISCCHHTACTLVHLPFTLKDSLISLKWPYTLCNLFWNTR